MTRRPVDQLLLLHASNSRARLVRRLVWLGVGLALNLKQMNSEFPKTEGDDK